MLSLLAMLPAVAAAASRPAFVWQGAVDGVVEIEMHSREVRVKAVEGAGPEDSLWRLSKPLPTETRRFP